MLLQKNADDQKDMADRNSVQEIKAVVAILKQSFDSGKIEDDIKGTITETSIPYKRALEGAGVPPPMVKEYLLNGVEAARELSGLGVKPGQLKNMLVEKNEEALRNIINQQEQQQIAQLQEEQRQQSIMQQNMALQQSLQGGVLG